jgi:hypothetical protein
MMIAGTGIEILSLRDLTVRAAEVGNSFAEYLQAPYLAVCIESFFIRVSHIDCLDAAALAVQDDETTGPNLAAYAITDLDPSHLAAESKHTLVRLVSDAVSQLDDAVFMGPQPIGTSFEFINRRGIEMEMITHGLQTGTLPSLCGIEFPAASRLAILSRVSAHA